MAEGAGGRGRRTPSAAAAETPEKTATKAPGWFVICKVDQMGTELDADSPLPIKIGEKLTVVKVVNPPKGKGADHVARQHKLEKEEEWKKARAAGSHVDYPDGLPEHFPAYHYRVISLGSFTPGHGVEEVREAKGSTF